MKVGDLVKWRHLRGQKDETDIGVVSTLMATPITVAKVMWPDGDHKWYPLIDLEVIDASR
jgi:hypothetical protein